MDETELSLEGVAVLRWAMSLINKIRTYLLYVFIEKINGQANQIEIQITIAVIAILLDSDVNVEA